MGRISGPPLVLGCKLVSAELTKKGLEVCSLLPQQLVNPPTALAERESCLCIHSPCGNGATPPPALFRPLSTLSCRAWLILCLVMVGRLQAFSKPFAGWTSKLQGYRDLRRWEKMRSTTSKDCKGFTSAFSCAIPEVNFQGKGFVDWKDRARESLRISWW